MKNLLYAIYLLFGMGVIIYTTVELWHICLPLSIVIICTQISGVFKDVARKISEEEKTPKQELAKDIAFLPVDAYIVYILWSANLALAVAYIIVAAIALLDQILLAKNDKILSRQ